ncbi:MAG: hypothetical protein ABJH63_13790 [Rhizobiaceae bacterium]
MLVDLIAEYYQVQKRLNQQIKNDDLSNIAALDSAMTRVCEQIFAHNVQCDIERSEKLEFLLNLLSPAASRTKFEERICELILDTGILDTGQFTPKDR